MIKRKTVTVQEIFLIIQTVMFVFLCTQTQLGHYENSTFLSAMITSCIGLFIVAFSIFKLPTGKKQKIILFGIFCLSLLSIAWIILSLLAKFAVTSMP